jgi:peroxiredoxin
MLKPGMKAPDFLLPDVQGQLVSLSSLVHDGPAVLVFYRGGWCHYCNIQLRGLERFFPQMRATGASLVAISPQLPDNSLSTAEKNNLHYPVLSDVGNHIARRFGIGFELSDELTTLYRNFGHALEEVNGKSGASELPIPAVFLVSSDLTVIHAASDADYTRRMDPEEILSALHAYSNQMLFASI